MDILLKLRNQMQQYEPQPQQYLFKHTYDAAKEVYDNCIRVINEALCYYCTEHAHCEWFCDGKCFEPKENLINNTKEILGRNQEKQYLEQAISTLIYGKCLCCANREGCQLPSNYLRSECYEEDPQVMQEIKSGKGLRRI